MKGKSKNKWLIVLFIVAAAVNVMAAIYGNSAKMLASHITSSGWVEVPATIDIVKLVEETDDTTTYSIESKYSYRYDGVEYQGNRVSFGSGDNNIGNYWQKLANNLTSLMDQNDASAFVNPDDPTKSVLDRSLRWESIIFGSVLLITLCGIAGFLTWRSPSKKNRRRARPQSKQGGIDSVQRSEFWLMAPIGVLFLIVGTSTSILHLPDALSKGEYALLMLPLFAIAGVAILYAAFRQVQAYRRFGPTPLFLDPSVPGVGGQLGGRFSINAWGIDPEASSTTQLWVRLVCTRHTRRRGRSSNKSGMTEVLLDIGCPVYLTQTAQGLDASFVFDIPDSCIATLEPTNANPTSGKSNFRVSVLGITTSGKSNLRVSVDWKLLVEGDFRTSALGNFRRQWDIVVGENAAQALQEFNIPQNFEREARQKAEDTAITTVLDRVSVTGDSQTINVNSKPGQAANGGLLMLLIGIVTLLAGSFFITQNSWIFGPLFTLIGGYMFLHVFYRLGKSIDVKFDKQSRVLATKESWYGRVYARHQVNVLNTEQFNIRLTSVVTRNNKKTELYAVEFKSRNKAIRIADEIEGKTTALALVDAIAVCGEGNS